MNYNCISGAEVLTCEAALAEFCGKAKGTLQALYHTEPFENELPMEWAADTSKRLREAGLTLANAKQSTTRIITAEDYEVSEVKTHVEARTAIIGAWMSLPASVRHSQAFNAQGLLFALLKEIEKAPEADAVRMDSKKFTPKMRENAIIVQRMAQAQNFIYARTDFWINLSCRKLYFHHQAIELGDVINEFSGMRREALAEADRLGVNNQVVSMLRNNEQMNYAQAKSLGAVIKGARTPFAFQDTSRAIVQTLVALEQAQYDYRNEPKWNRAYGCWMGTHEQLLEVVDKARAYVKRFKEVQSRLDSMGLHGDIEIPCTALNWSTLREVEQVDEVLDSLAPEQNDLSAEGIFDDDPYSYEEGALSTEGIFDNNEDPDETHVFDEDADLMEDLLHDIMYSGKGRARLMEQAAKGTITEEDALEIFHLHMEDTREAILRANALKRGGGGYGL